MNKLIFRIISVAFLISNLYLGYSIHQKLSKYQRYKVAYASELNFQSSLLDFKDYINSSEWDNTKKTSRDRLKKLVVAKDKANTLGFFSLITLLLFGGFAFIGFKKFNLSKKQLGIALLHISLVTLCIGICVPFLELGAFMQDLEVNGLGISKTFDGKMYFFYQCKSALGLIQTLFQGNNYVVGIAILVFSILSPFTKLFLYYRHFLLEKNNSNSKLLKIASYIGKYSMADVFVAACFLAFLSFNNLNVGVKTESASLLGLYFFFGYCIVSIGVYYLIEDKKEKNNSELNSLDELI